jgi:hypothetical protein
MRSTAVMRAKEWVRVAIRGAVAQIAHGLGRNAVDELVPFVSVKYRRLARFDHERWALGWWPHSLVRPDPWQAN